eukprot:CAMPEP_0173430904 /NCGR_PEP_ID=MMETSP1357-20121228/9204_1 /TAXON_ID=77926 /ORGANISM="Hemiselmis rufescens, Strain PCC563" /LENGTH=66 /DNA_ID=CAMNT_0014395317 /DNA_START=127 /DNA_END=327 /DNA_ORIENTATION=-
MYAAKALRTAATTMARSMSSGSGSSSGVSGILYLIPPALVIGGYGGTVCMSETGSLSRIHTTFRAQ